MKIKQFIMIITGVFFSLKDQQKNKNILLAPEKQS